MFLYGYDARTLPYNPNPDPKIKTTYVLLYIQLELYGINYLDLIQGLASVKGSFREWWTDKALEWNKT